MKIFLGTIGCRLNLAEIERYAQQFYQAGHTLVNTPQEADLAVINTCTVTAAAASDSRQKIRQVFRSGIENVIVTGCWATLYPDETLRMEGVQRVILNPQKDDLVPNLLLNSPEEFDLEPVERHIGSGTRLRTRAFVKVQDGCDNHCTFCITRIARGPGRSIAAEEVLRNVNQVLENQNEIPGAQEVVLTGVHLGSWGQDLSPRQHLSDLVRLILENTSVPRLRLSSLEPWDLDETFFSLWDNPRLCRHLHLPLQSGSQATLHRMARKTTTETYKNLVEAARGVIPDVAITTDVIVGFPGENEIEFQESLDFIREMNFSGGHVFSYSSRPGTAAIRIPGKVAKHTIKTHSSLVRQVLEESALTYRQKFIGQKLSVLWEMSAVESPPGWEINGLTDNYLRVMAYAPQTLWNQLTPVLMTGVTPNGMVGTI